MKNYPGPESDDTKRFTDEGTDKRIHELLMNENDSVSEQDISNIRTDVANTGNETEVEIAEPSTAAPSDIEGNPEDKKIRDDNDPEIDTSWNILGA